MNKVEFFPLTPDTGHTDPHSKWLLSTDSKLPQPLSALYPPWRRLVVVWLDLTVDASHSDATSDVGVGLAQVQAADRHAGLALDGARGGAEL